MTLRQAIELMKQSASAWADDRAPSIGAAISYYTVFSIAPLLLIATAVAGLVFGEDAARGAVVEQLRGLLGDSGAQAIQGLIESAAKPKDGVFATLIGLFLLLVGATTVFAELQDALDRIWRAPDRVQVRGLWGLLRSRLLSFGMIMGIGFLLLVSLIVSAVIAALGNWWGPIFGGWETLANGVNFIFSFALITVLFALIYKIMPRVHIQWPDVWVGAAVTALLFTIGKYLIGLYIGKSGVTSGFGAAGSVAVILLWVYYSAQIFLLGAEYTWVYAHTLGSLSDKTKQPVGSMLDAKPGIAITPSKADPVNSRLAARVANKPGQAIGVAMLLGACAAAGVKMIVRVKHSRELLHRRRVSAPPMSLRGH